MLKGKELEGLRSKLLKSAAEFYEKLEKLLKNQTDRSSRAVLAQSYYELGELTSKIGDQSAALGVHRRGLALRGAGYSTRFRSIGANRSGTQPDRGRHTNAGDRQARRRHLSLGGVAQIDGNARNGSRRTCRGPRNPGR